MTNDLLELRLPLKLRHLDVLRATAGVIAGTNSFTYDEILQIRVAVSELFEWALRRLSPEWMAWAQDNFVVSFRVEDNKLEVLVSGPSDFVQSLHGKGQEESLELLKSLMDEVTFRAESVDKTLVGMVKYKSTTGPSLGRAQWG